MSVPCAREQVTIQGDNGMEEQLPQIGDADRPVVEFEFEQTAVKVEKSAKAAVLTVRRAVPLGGTPSAAQAWAGSVSFQTMSMTATAGEDFEDAQGVLTFAPNQASATISVPLINDEEAEDDKVFAAQLHSPSEGAVLSSSKSRCEAGCARKSS